MNSFLIQCKVRKAELLQFLGITAVGYLIGLIVVFIVMNVAKENTCATAGTMLAVIAFAFIHLFGKTLSFMGDFNMAISLGATRKSFVSGYVLFNLLEILWAVWMIICLVPMNIAKNEKLSGELAKLGLFLGGKFTPQGIVALVIALTIVVAAITWNILRKQRVTA